MTSAFDEGDNTSGFMQCSSRMCRMRSLALKRVETWLKLSVLPPIGAAVIRGLGRSMRMDSQGHEQGDALYRQGRGVRLTGIDSPWTLRCRPCRDSRWAQGASPNCEGWSDSTGKGDRTSDCAAGI